MLKRQTGGEVREGLSVGVGEGDWESGGFPSALSNGTA